VQVGLSHDTRDAVEARLEHDRETVERALDAFLPQGGAGPAGGRSHPRRTLGAAHESAPPGPLHDAMRHSVFGGGKRLRPILVMAAAEVAGAVPATVLPAACAVELIHTYSLVHDDLPAMDNSPTRRGRPACHVVYGDAVAVLAGDALHAYAFELLARNAETPGIGAGAVVRAIGELSVSIGSAGMVGGQVLDLLAAGTDPVARGTPAGGDARARIAAADVRGIHRLKTGALLRACLRIGGILGDASAETLDALSRYGEDVGLSFQIVDDILDVVGEQGKLGKGTGTDAAQAKITFPLVFGLADSRRLAREATERAVAALQPLGKRGRWLCDLAIFLLSRDR
jgi:geranylgeranyl diphosphate synthase type II